jgi:hypothetical protein
MPFGGRPAAGSALEVVPGELRLQADELGPGFRGRAPFAGEHPPGDGPVADRALQLEHVGELRRERPGRRDGPHRRLGLLLMRRLTHRATVPGCSGPVNRA